MERSNKLTEAQEERLGVAVEEFGEALQAIGKIVRYGYDNQWLGEGPTKKQKLEEEIAHCMIAINMLIATKDISLDALEQHYNKKKEFIQNHLLHQEGEFDWNEL